MTKKDICSLLGLSLIISWLSFPPPLYAQTAELESILINRSPVSNIEKSDWIKEAATIEILGRNKAAKITMSVTPDSGKIKITLAQNYAAKVFVNERVQDSLFIQLPKEIKKYKTGLKLDKASGSMYVFLEVRPGNKLRFTTTDLLIVPVVFKLLNQPFRWLFPKKIKIEIFKEET